MSTIKIVNALIHNIFVYIVGYLEKLMLKEAQVLVELYFRWEEREQNLYP
jgi:hypothetical protein